MKFEMKKSHIAKAVALALCGAFVASAQAAPTVISSGLTSATIDDAGYFSNAGPLGMSYNGREFVNLGTPASNWWLNSGGVAVAVADEVVGNNPLATTAFGVGGLISVVTNLGGGGGLNPVGLMTGMAIGGVMGNQMGGMMNNMNNTPPPPPVSTYHVALNGQQLGQFTIEQLIFTFINKQSL